MKRLLYILLTIALLAGSAGQAAAPTPPPPSPAFMAVNDAVQNAIATHQEMVLPLLVYKTRLDPLRLSSDGSWATAEIAPIDPESGEVVPLEPGLAIARLVEGAWQVSLPGDFSWLQDLQLLPEDLMSAADRQDWLLRAEVGIPQQPSAPFTGYRLPWAAGSTLYMTQSTHHDYYTPSGTAHYAFDFAGAYPSGMFPLHAAKNGVVHMARWTQTNGDPATPGNYLILRDDTTTPVSYQLYLHFAKDTIPEALRIPGTPVTRGQYLGLADDTGISSGNHVHFHVHLNPDSYWGQSVDITFDDVDINGGRPRIKDDLPFCNWPGDVCTSTRNTYVSLNYPPVDPDPPQGGITAPAETSLVQTGSLNLAGWATDSALPVTARFKAYYNGAWRLISPELKTSPFSYTWDICAAGVPDGPLSLALELRDAEGNFASGLPGLTQVVKHAACPAPPPICQPGSGQVALYSGVGYSGACLLLGIGSHQSSALSPLGTASAASLRLGGGVQITLFDLGDLTGRSSTFFRDDANLSDNPVGSGSAGSALVQAAGAPAVPRPLWPASGTVFDLADTSVSPSWQDAGGAAEYRVRLDGVDQAWQTEPALAPRAFAPGAHTWQVQARNTSGTSLWSVESAFTIGASAASPVSRTAPFSDTFETTPGIWSHSNNWDLSTQQNHTPGGAIVYSYDTASANGYDTGAPNHGDLNSPNIFLPGAGYYLRFWYRYETESPGLFWDRRWVQASTDGVTYTNLLQLQDDPPNVWLQSPAINLSAYAGKNVRLRFHFETLDAVSNGFQGWFIDDVSVLAAPPPACSTANEPDDAPSQARSLVYGSTVSGQICPGGDRDYFRFTAAAGDTIGASVRAQADGSALDSYLFLLASDGSSVLAENDDIVLGEQTDSALQAVLPETGDYYLKLRAWNHPSAGGAAYTYALGLYRDGEDPEAALIQPLSGAVLPAALPIRLEASASDAASGIGRVEFAWHSADWLAGAWQVLGSDTDGSDGWSFDFDPGSLADQSGLAFSIAAYDRAGNGSPAAAWHLTLDRTSPQSALAALPPVSASTVLHLEWSASDNLAGLDHFDLQVQVENGSWQDAISNIPGSQRQIFYIGAPGKLYAFRLRAVDKAGNTEAYPLSGESVTLIPDSICSTLDAFEVDNTSAQAQPVSLLPARQSHTFCSGSSLDDQDWLRLEAQVGKTLVIYAHPISIETSIRLRLYAHNGTTLLAEAVPSSYGQTTLLRWVPQSTGTVYLQTTHPQTGASGSSLAYLLYLGIRPVYLPFIGLKP